MNSIRAACRFLAELNNKWSWRKIRETFHIYWRKPVMHRDTGVERSTKCNAILWGYRESELDLTWISKLSLWHSAKILGDSISHDFLCTAVSLLPIKPRENMVKCFINKIATGELRCILVVSYYPQCTALIGRTVILAMTYRSWVARAVQWPS